METPTQSVESLIRTYLSSRRLMQLATAHDNQPWCCTVHYYAEGLNIYWTSFTNRRHSQEIAANPRVAAAVMIEPEWPVIGLQIEGQATIVDAGEAKRILPAYIERLGKPTQTYDELIAGGGQLYCLTPANFVLFDPRDFKDSHRQEWQPAQ